MPAIHSATRAANTPARSLRRRTVHPRGCPDSCLRPDPCTAVANGDRGARAPRAYAVADDPLDLGQYRCRIQAALAARPDAVATHESALALHGLAAVVRRAAWGSTGLVEHGCGTEPAARTWSCGPGRCPTTTSPAPSTVQRPPLVVPRWIWPACPVPAGTDCRRRVQRPRSAAGQDWDGVWPTPVAMDRSSAD